MLSKLPSDVVRNGVIAASLCALAAAALAQSAADNVPVSNNAGGRLQMVGLRDLDTNSFAGSVPNGVTDDSLAETPAARIDMAKVWSYLPKHPDGPSPSVVIGPDNRTQLVNASAYPARAIGLLTFTQNGGGYICTGWLINKNTVATAGHCVYDTTNNAWSTDVTFYPGVNGGTAPYGSCTAKTLHSVNGWTVGHKPTSDYGAIRLNCNIGTTVGWFGFFWQSATLTGTTVTVQGYPGDKAYSTQWKHQGPIKATKARQTCYSIDTYGGESGSPVYQPNRTGGICTGVCANSIHAYGPWNDGPTDPCLTNMNRGTRIIESVFNNLVAWKNAP